VGRKKVKTKTCAKSDPPVDHGHRKNGEVIRFRVEIKKRRGRRSRNADKKENMGEER